LHEGAYDTAAAVKKEYPSFYLGIRIDTFEDAKRSVQAGADFIITLSVNDDIVTYAAKNNISVFPMVYLKKDVDRAVSIGIDTVVYQPILLHEQADPLDFPTPSHKDVNFILYGVKPEWIDLYIYGDIRRSCILKLPQANIGAFLRAATAKVLGFKFMHLGINNPDEKAAREIMKVLEETFFIPAIERPGAVFMGTDIEVLFKRMRGEHGHIGFSVHNMQRALAYLKRRGIGIIEETAQFDEQDIMRFVYTDLEVGGFAVHLRQL
jgi:2-dehydro-3-deoxyphosphogluconate aldolase/(4S)-4-hydroxy-2-oxoglutarate aldolase